MKQRQRVDVKGFRVMREQYIEMGIVVICSLILSNFLMDVLNVILLSEILV